MPRCILVTSTADFERLFNPTTPKTPVDLTRCYVCSAKLELKQSRHGLFYGCSTWKKTGCPGSHPANPDGSLRDLPVDEKTVEARAMAAALFNELWKSGRMTVEQARRWLAEQLNISASQAYVGALSAEQCELVVERIGESLTEDEQLRMAERDLVGADADMLSTEDRIFLASVPRDRELLGNRLRGGFLQAGRVCRLLGISLGADGPTTIRNIAKALADHDQRSIRSSQRQRGYRPQFGPTGGV